MTQEEAVQSILTNAKRLKPDLDTESGAILFYAEKLTGDILAYCHRKDFPAQLVYTAVELILKRLEDEDTDEINGVTIKGPLSSLKMDDTEYKFAVSSVSAVGTMAEEDFNTIKPKLNLYRKLAGFP